jgi:hypothetical protein
LKSNVIWNFYMKIQNVNNFFMIYHISMYSWLSLSRTRLTRISGWVKFLSNSQTSLCVNIYNLTLDESKFRLSRIKVLVPRCRKPYYLHSLSQIYLSKHVYYFGLKIGSQVKHPVIDFVYNQKLSIHNKCRLGRQTSMIMKSTQRKRFIYWIICRKLILTQEDV